MPNDAVDCSREAVERDVQTVVAIFDEDGEGLPLSLHSLTEKCRALLARAEASEGMHEAHVRGLVAAHQDEARTLKAQIKQVKAERGAARAEARKMRDLGVFFLARLSEWSSDNLTDEGARDWFGHVEPAMERFRAALEGGAK